MRVSDFNNRGREERGENKVKRWKIRGYSNGKPYDTTHRGTWQEAYDHAKYDLELTGIDVR